MENIDLLHVWENWILENLFVESFQNTSTFEMAEQMSEKDIYGRIDKFKKKRAKYILKWTDEKMPDNIIEMNVTDQMILMTKVTTLKTVAHMRAHERTAAVAKLELISQIKTRQALEIRSVHIIFHSN